MKQIYEDLSDDTDFDIIDLDDVPDRDTVKRRKKKSQRDVNKTNKSEEVKSSLFMCSLRREAIAMLIILKRGKIAVVNMAPEVPR